MVIATGNPKQGVSLKSQLFQNTVYHEIYADLNFLEGLLNRIFALFISRIRQNIYTLGCDINNYIFTKENFLKHEICKNFVSRKFQFFSSQNLIPCFLTLCSTIKFNPYFTF